MLMSGGRKCPVAARLGPNVRMIVSHSVMPTTEAPMTRNTSDPMRLAVHSGAGSTASAIAAQGMPPAKLCSPVENHGFPGGTSFGVREVPAMRHATATAPMPMPVIDVSADPIRARPDPATPRKPRMQPPTCTFRSRSPCAAEMASTASGVVEVKMAAMPVDRCGNATAMRPRYPALLRRPTTAIPANPRGGMAPTARQSKSVNSSPAQTQRMATTVKGPASFKAIFTAMNAPDQRQAQVPTRVTKRSDMAMTLPGADVGPFEHFMPS